jgi:hypothetical protein
VASGIATANKNLDQAEYTADGRRVWYVDNVNDGTGDTGTQAAPFDTFAAAASASGTGDVIIVAKGTYVEQCVPKDGQRIIGAGPSLTIFQRSTVASAALNLANKNDVYVEGIQFEHTGSWAGILPSGSFRCTLKNCWGAGPFDGIRGDNATSLLCEGCRFTSAYDGAAVNGTNIRFIGCYFETTAAAVTPSTAVGAFRTSSGSATANTVSVLIKDSTLAVRKTIANASKCCCLEVDETATVILENVTMIAESTHASDTGILAGVISSDTCRCEVKGSSVYTTNAGSGGTYDLRVEDTSSLLVDPSSTAYSTAKLSGTPITPIMTAAVAAQTRVELALPPFAYDAAGGLPISAAGGLDMDGLSTFNAASDSVALDADQSSVTVLGGVDVTGGTVAASGDWNTMTPPTADENANTLLAKAVPVSPTADTVGEFFKFQRSTLASDGVFTEASLADAPAGEGGGTLAPADVMPVGYTWQVSGSGDESLRTAATDDGLVTTPGGLTDYRAGINCRITRILPAGTVLKTIGTPVSSDETAVTVANTEGRSCDATVAKMEVTILADAEPGVYWITQPVTNSADDGPFDIYVKVTIKAAPE